MADHVGIVGNTYGNGDPIIEIDAVSGYKVAARTFPLVYEIDKTSTKETGSFVEPKTDQHFTISPDDKVGVVGHDFGFDQIWNRLWYVPTEMELGFILEDIEREIKIWNAYFDRTIEVTVVSTIGASGVDISHDPVPFTIPIQGETTATVTIYRSGPPLQDTIFQFTIDSSLYQTQVTGSRVAPWPYEPNWNVRPRLTYIFKTAISKNRRLYEQRRPLRSIGLRKMTVTTWLQSISMQQAKQRLAYGHDKAFGIPIYSEQCYAASDFSGLSIITTSNDLTKHWNLNNNCSFVIIIDPFTEESEIKVVDMIDANSIAVTRSISTGIFNYRSAIIYPMFIATLESIELPGHTDNLQDIQAEFLEYENGE